jgi:hypothetical protein
MNSEELLILMALTLKKMEEKDEYTFKRILLIEKKGNIYFSVREFIDRIHKNPFYKNPNTIPEKQND